MHEAKEVQEKVCTFFGIASFREHQIVILEKTLFEKKDTLVILPCAFGKSLCFEAVTYTNSLLHGGDYEDTMCLVMSPFKVLMDMQTSRLNRLGIPAVNLGNTGDLQDIEKGKYR